MRQLLVLGLAGILAGAALGAARHRAPRALIGGFLVLAAVALGLSLIMLPHDT